MGCRDDVVLGIKKKVRKDFNLPTSWRAGSYLSLTNETLRCSFSNSPSISLNYPSKISKFIQLFFCPRYQQGSFFIPLKHRGFSDLLMTNIGNFSPFMLAPASPARQILLCLGPAHFPFFNLRYF